MIRSTVNLSALCHISCSNTMNLHAFIWQKTQQLFTDQQYETDNIKKKAATGTYSTTETSARRRRILLFFHTVCFIYRAKAVNCLFPFMSSMWILWVVWQAAVQLETTSEVINRWCTLLPQGYQRRNPGTPPVWTHWTPSAFNTAHSSAPLLAN